MDRDPQSLRSRPLRPSRTKLGKERSVNTVESTGPANNPLQSDRGWNVSDWYSVLVTVHPSTPAFNSATLAGSELQLRVWRWRDRAGKGSGRPEGQWFADEDIVFCLDGNTALGTSMERMLMTKQAENIYLQVIRLDSPLGTSITAEIALYGVGDKRQSLSDPTPYTGISIPDPTPEIVGAAAPFLQDAMMSNLAGDFTATYVSAQRVTCVGTFEIAATSWIDGSHVIMVGRKPASGIGTETEFTLLTRGVNLDCHAVASNATTFDVYLDDPFFAATDEIIVFIAGPRHRYEVTGIDGTKRQQTRDEAFTIATQSERVEEIDPLHQQYVPDILADGASIALGTTVDFYLDMAGYRFLSIEWIPSTADLSLTVEATNEDNETAPASCDYLNVCTAWFGAGAFTASAFLFLTVHTFVKYVHIEVTNSDEVNPHTHKLFVRRGW